MKEKLVLIGNGMAGIRTIEELLKLAPEKYDITVFGDEPHPNYNRIMLSPARNSSTKSCSTARSGMRKTVSSCIVARR
jgi:NAD(P)H-nitrite reductase large subunit